MRCTTSFARPLLPLFSLVLAAAACAPATNGGNGEDDDPPDDMVPVVRNDGGRTPPRAGSSGSTAGSTGTTGGSTGMTGGTGGSTSSTGGTGGGAGGAGGRAGSSGSGGSGGKDAGATPDTAGPVFDAAGPRVQTVVPVVALEAAGTIPNEPKVDGAIKIYATPPATYSTPPALMDLAMTPVTLMSPMGIELRGRSTRGYPKKPYSIELQTAMKTGNPQALFGMPPEADFALLACWLDRTCLRTALAFHLANEMRTPFNGGTLWHPRLEFIELFMKDQYYGTYNWVERVKKDRYRVNIPAPAKDMAAGDITGGYMLRIEFVGRGEITIAGKTYNRDFTVSPSQQVWTYFYPRVEDITEAQKAYIKDWATRFEAAANGADREDPEKGYRKFIDVRSWVDYMLVRELAREVDSYRLSFYMMKLPDSMGGKVYAGPQWDFDRGFGNANYYDANKPEGGWSFEGPPRPAKKGEEAATFAKNIFKSPSFQKELACRWKEVRKTFMTTAHINAQLDKWDTIWTKPQERDEAKWKLAGTYTDSIPTHRLYKTALSGLKTWNEKRIAWMDSQLNPKCP